MGSRINALPFANGTEASNCLDSIHHILSRIETRNDVVQETIPVENNETSISALIKMTTLKD